MFLQCQSSHGCCIDTDDDRVLKKHDVEVPFSEMMPVTKYFETRV